MPCHLQKKLRMTTFYIFTQQKLNQLILAKAVFSFFKRDCYDFKLHYYLLK